MIRRLPALLKAASRARKRAYAPYSGYEVGAAILAGGRIYAGANVENSAYPLSVCAERNAIAMVVAAGAARKIEAIAVVGGVDRPAAPCGGCRQVLAEFAPAGTPVVYASSDGQSVTTTVGALLPSAFGPVDLIRAAAVESTGRKRGPAGIARSAARVRGTRSSGRRRSP